MKPAYIEMFYTLRRNIAKYIIPEFFWPKYVLLDNVKINLRGTPYFFGVKLGLKKGEYEAPERNLLKPLNLHDAIVIEMGGSIGILTAILAYKVGANGKVISIEASERISSYSRRWLEKNPNTRVIKGFAFPVQELKVSVDIIEFEESGMSTAGVVYFDTNKKNINNVSNIFDIQRISDISKIVPTVLVVDIEGSEKIILDQKPDFQSSIKLILIELHPNIYGETSKLKIINIIEDEGFVVKSFEENVLLFERIIK